MKEVDYETETMTVYCDALECDEDYDCDTTSYSEANDELRANGWFMRKIKGRFVDFCCKECLNKYLAQE